MHSFTDSTTQSLGLTNMQQVQHRNELFGEYLEHQGKIRSQSEPHTFKSFEPKAFTGNSKRGLMHKMQIFLK
jgi:hypothetical protein